MKMEGKQITRHRLKSPFWRPNPNPDFEPYKSGNWWCISIQYLGVWKYRTEADAIADIPALKNYRRSILHQIEVANAKYFRKCEQAEKERERELKNYRKQKSKHYGIKHLTNSQKNRLIRLIQEGADELTCKELFEISTHVYAALKARYGDSK